jgi:hypothetical protein
VLTEDDVRAIRRARGLETLHQLASKYGVGQTTIHNIHSGKTWSWLP